MTAPAAARTRDPKLRRLVLYPTELPEQLARVYSNSSRSGLQALFADMQSNAYEKSARYIKICRRVTSRQESQRLAEFPHCPSEFAPLQIPTYRGFFSKPTRIIPTRSQSHCSYRIHTRLCEGENHILMRTPCSISRLLTRRASAGCSHHGGGAISSVPH